MNVIKMLNKENLFIADHFADTDSFYSQYALFLKNRGIIKDNEKVKRLFIKEKTFSQQQLEREQPLLTFFPESLRNLYFQLL